MTDNIYEYIRSLGYKVNTGDKPNDSMILDRTPNMTNISNALGSITNEGFEHRCQCLAGWYLVPSTSWVFKYNGNNYLVIIHDDEVIGGYII